MLEPRSRLASLRRCLCTVALGLGMLAHLGGCRAKPVEASPPAVPPTGADSDAEGAGPGGPRANPDDAAQARCTAEGTRWDGKHEGCLYEVAGCCYPAPGPACSAAGCDGADCQILESAPAQVRCSTAGR